MDESSSTDLILSALITGTTIDYSALENSEQMLRDILETRALYEGIFPEMEDIFVLHDKIDEYLFYIAEYGTARGLELFGMERCLLILSYFKTKINAALGMT